MIINFNFFKWLYYNIYKKNIKFIFIFKKFLNLISFNKAIIYNIKILLSIFNIFAKNYFYYNFFIFNYKQFFDYIYKKLS